MKLCFDHCYNFLLVDVSIKQVIIIKKKLSKNDFKFHDLSTLNITQIPKTDSFTFLNNISGGLVLFMGIAFPYLIEFFQFILEIILIIFIRKIN